MLDVPIADPAAAGPAPFTAEQMRRLRRTLGRSPFYVDDNAFLRINVWSGVPITLQVTVRIGRPTGEQAAERFLITVPGNHTLVQQDFFLGEGLLFNVTAVAPNSTGRIGQSYLNVSLLQGSGAANTLLAQLLGGQINNAQASSWPASVIEPSTTVEAVIRTVIGTTPAHNNDINELVPTGVVWELISFTAHIQENGAGHPKPGLQILDPSGNEILYVTSNFDVFNIGALIFWVAGLGYEGAVDQFQKAIGIPTTFRLPAGCRIQTFTNYVGPNFDYLAPKYLIREWQEGT